MVVLITIFAACNTPQAAESKAPEASPVVAKSAPNPSPSIPLPAPTAPTPQNFAGIHNVVAFAAGVLSGSAPDDDSAFDTLAAMGIRTIISVDGAQPEVESAARRGIRYVHLPIGYNGMDRERTLEIARAIKELPGPIYIHCHHGKHRSAAAAGAALVALGETNPARATERMKVSGTSPSYPGLYQCVATAAVATDAELKSASAAFPQRWQTTGLVKSMVEIDEVFDRLKLIESSGWRVPPQHPDLVPAAEAGRLADLFRNLQDDDRCRTKPTQFMDAISGSAIVAAQLEQSLIAGNSPTRELTERFATLSQSCKDCHKQFRD